MISGLRWRHIIWFSTSLLLLCMTATAKTPYSLNWNLPLDTGKSLWGGFQNFIKAQGDLADQLDKATAEKYGVSPNEKRLNSCVTDPQHNVELKISELQSLLNEPPPTREAVIDLLGLPVCQLVTGEDQWFVEGGQILGVTYAPTRVQIRKVNP